jgi:hypothetical protein
MRYTHNSSPTHSMLIQLSHHAPSRNEVQILWQWQLDRDLEDPASENRPQLGIFNFAVSLPSFQLRLIT